MDLDHVGGLLTVIEQIKVNTVLISKQGKKSENYEKFMQIVNEKNIKLICVGINGANNRCRINIEKNLYFDILWPNNLELIDENVLNNNSIVCKLYYNTFSMLFTGDIEEIAERKILNEYKENLQILNSTVLKVAHHGSKTSSIKEFVEVVKPRISLIGVGKNNKFGHPNDETLKKLENIRLKNI